MEKPHKRAITLSGGPAELARALGVTSQAISQWTRVPIDRVLQVERLSGMSRYKLRPDIFGAAPRQAMRKHPKIDTVA